MQKKAIERFKILLAVMLFIFTVSSALFVAHEMHHQCSGEDCHICHIIQICQQNIKLLSFALTAFAVIQLPKVNFSKFENPKTQSACNSDTLVSRKIRLND